MRPIRSALSFLSVFPGSRSYPVMAEFETLVFPDFHAKCDPLACSEAPARRGSPQGRDS